MNEQIEGQQIPEVVSTDSEVTNVDLTAEPQETLGAGEYVTGVTPEATDPYEVLRGNALSNDLDFNSDVLAEAMYQDSISAAKELENKVAGKQIFSGHRSVEEARLLLHLTRKQGFDALTNEKAKLVDTDYYKYMGKVVEDIVGAGVEQNRMIIRDAETGAEVEAKDMEVNLADANFVYTDPETGEVFTGEAARKKMGINLEMILAEKANNDGLQNHDTSELAYRAQRSMVVQDQILEQQKSQALQRARMRDLERREAISGGNDTAVAVAGFTAHAIPGYGTVSNKQIQDIFRKYKLLPEEGGAKKLFRAVAMEDFSIEDAAEAIKEMEKVDKAKAYDVMIQVSNELLDAGLVFQDVLAADNAITALDEGTDYSTARKVFFGLLGVADLIPFAGAAVDAVKGAKVGSAIAEAGGTSKVQGAVIGAATGVATEFKYVGKTWKDYTGTKLTPYGQAALDNTMSRMTGLDNFDADFIKRYKEAEQAAKDAGELFDPWKVIQNEAVTARLNRSTMGSKSVEPATVGEKLKVFNDLNRAVEEKAAFQHVTNGADPVSPAAIDMSYKGNSVVEMLNHAFETGDKDYLMATFGTDDIGQAYMKVAGTQFSDSKALTYREITDRIAQGEHQAIRETIKTHNSPLSDPEKEKAVRNIVATYEDSNVKLDKSSVHFFRDGDNVKVGVVVKGADGEAFKSAREAIDSVLYATRNAGVTEGDIEVVVRRGNKLEPITRADLEAEAALKRAQALEGFMEGTLTEAELNRLLRDARFSEAGEELADDVKTISDRLRGSIGASDLGKDLKKDINNVNKHAKVISEAVKQRDKALVDAAHARKVKESLEKQVQLKTDELKSLDDSAKADAAEFRLQKAIERLGQASEKANSLAIVASNRATKASETILSSTKDLKSSMENINSKVMAARDAELTKPISKMDDKILQAARDVKDLNDTIRGFKAPLGDGDKASEKVITGVPDTGEYFVRISKEATITGKSVGEELDGLEITKVGGLQVNFIESIFNKGDVQLFKGETGALTNFLTDFVSTIKTPQMARALSNAYDQMSLTQKQMFNTTGQYVVNLAKKLDRAEQERVAQYLDRANREERAWDANEIEWAKAEFDLGDNAVALITNFRKINNVVWELDNLDAIANARASGFRILTDSEGTFLLGRELTSKGSATNLLNEAGGKLKVVDVDTGDVLTVTREQLDQLYENGGNIFKTEVGILKNGELHHNVLNPNKAGVRYAREVSDHDHLLNFKDGYYKRAWEGNYKIVRTVKNSDGGVERRAIGAARTKTQAAQLQRLMLDKSPTDDLTIEFMNETLERSGDAIRGLENVGIRSSQRMRGAPLAGLGEDLAEQVGYADSVDPIKSLINSIYSATNRVHLRDVIETYRQRWLNTYGDLMKNDPVTGKPMYPSRVEDIGLSDTGKSVENATRLRDARTLYIMMENYENGFEDVVWDRVWRWAANSAADIAKNDKLEEAFLKAGNYSPTKLMKQFFVSAVLFTNFATQFIVQSNQIALTLSAAGVKASSQWAKYWPGIIYANSTGDIETVVKAYNMMGKGSGDRMRHLYETLVRSGMPAGVDKSILVRGVYKDLGERLSASSAASTVGHAAGTVTHGLRVVGMDAGEHVNVTTAFVTEYFKALNKGEDVTSPEVLNRAQFVARQISGGMNRAGEMAYNGNFLGGMMQFMQIGHKMINNMTINPHIPKGDKVRMWVGMMATWGISYEMLAGGQLDWLKNAVPEGLIDEEGWYKISQGIMGNFVNTMIGFISGEEVSTKIDWSSRVRPISLGTAEFFASLITDQSIVKAMAQSPSGGLFFSHEDSPNVPRAANFIRMVADQFWPDDTKFKQSPDQVVEAGLELFGGYRSLKALFSSEVYMMNASGTVKFKDPTLTERLAAGFGAQSVESIHTRLLNTHTFESKEEQEQLIQEYTKYLGAQLATTGEPLHSSGNIAQVNRIIIHSLATGNPELAQKLQSRLKDSMLDGDQPHNLAVKRFLELAREQEEGFVEEVRKLPRALREDIKPYTGYDEVE